MSSRHDTGRTTLMGPDVTSYENTFLWMSSFH